MARHLTRRQALPAAVTIAAAVTSALPSGLAHAGPHRVCRHPGNTVDATFGDLQDTGFPFGAAIAPDGLTILSPGFFADRVGVWVRSTPTATDWALPTSFGEVGSGDGQFIGPGFACFSADGLTTLITDGTNNRVQVWTRANACSVVFRWQSTFGTAGSGDGQIGGPIASAITGNGLTAFIAEADNNRVSVWTRTHHARPFIWSGIACDTPFPSGVAVTQSGRTLFVLSYDQAAVTVLRREDRSTAWNPIATFGAPGSGDGQFLEPQTLAISRDGRLVYIADTGNNRVQCFIRRRQGDTWRWLDQITADGLFLPVGVSITPSADTVLITDTGNGNLVTLTGCT